MEIVLEDSVFLETPPWEVLLAVQEAIRERHSILPASFGGEGYLYWVEACVNKLDYRDVDALLATQATSSIFVESKRKCVVVPNRVTPNYLKGEVRFSELREYLLRSFYVYVENGRADRSFLKSLIEGADLDFVEDLEAMEYLVFENGGGIGELRMKLHADFGVRSLLNRRAIVVFDSDAPQPGEISNNASLVLRECNNLGIPHLCLTRRAIENYLPHEALIDFSEAGGRRREEWLRMARAHYRLDKVQKSHIHMKSGLSDAESKLPIYASVSPNDIAALSVGFGDGLSECYDVPGRVTLERYQHSGLEDEVRAIAKFLLEMI